MRVIAGEARGRRLEALPGTDITRPTLDQVKEAMFSIVQFDLPGARVLDLYAGSGQLGIEALSRGAARCVFLDENREAVNIVMKNCKNCGVFDRSRVNIGEAARFLSACREQFDLVLLDPPFRGGTLEKILPGARVLDLYAGSGQLGIEALSRGAARCVFLDENREAVNIVMKNCKTCGVFDRSRVNIGEAARYLSACREQFDLVLLDPPFHGGTLEKILPSVEKVLTPGGIALCESETGLVLPAEVGSLTLKKQYKYGKVLLWKYTKPMQPAGEEDAE